MKTRFKFFTMMLALSLSTSALADDAEVKSNAVPSKDVVSFNRLKQGVILNLPPQVISVKIAANYFLAPTGYTLVIPDTNPQQTANIISRSPSPIVSDGSFVSVDKALILLAGNDVDLVVDHLHKYVTYEMHNKGGAN